MTEPTPTPDHDLHAEQATIGAMLISPAVIEQIDQTIQAGDYYDPRHGTIHAAIVHLWGTRQPVDPLTVNRYLTSTGDSLKTGGPSYLHDCLAAAPSAANGPYYAQIVAGHAHDRKIELLAIQIHQIRTIPDPVRRHEKLVGVQQQLSILLEQTNHHAEIETTPFSQIAMRPVDWAWEGRIPIGEITLIPGREGVGKSTFLSWLAAAITRGTLPGHWYGTPRDILYAANEDSYERTIAPRAHAAGADMDRLHRINTRRYGQHTRVNLPRDLRLLPEVIKKHGVAAVLLDPAVSVLDDEINPNRARELRAVLEPLQAVADQTDTCIIGLVHFNKTRDTDASTMISGARAWIEVARAALVIARDKEQDEYTCVVSQLKNNLGRDDLPNLTYTINDTTITLDNGRDLSIGRLEWTGETDLHAEQILQRRPHSDQNRTAGNRGDNTNNILDWIEEQPAATPLRDICAQFPEIDPKTIKSILSRSVARGDLYRPTSGMYATRVVAEPTRPVVYEQPPLAGCRVCFAPSEDLDGSGLCDNCAHSE